MYIIFRLSSVPSGSHNLTMKAVKGARAHPGTDLTLNNASTCPLTEAEPHFRVGFDPKKLLKCRMYVNHTIFQSEPTRKNADQTNLGNFRTHLLPAVGGPVPPRHWV